MILFKSVAGHHQYFARGTTNIWHKCRRAVCNSAAWRVFGPPVPKPTAPLKRQGTLLAIKGSSSDYKLHKPRHIVDSDSDSDSESGSGSGSGSDGESGSESGSGSGSASYGESVSGSVSEGGSVSDFSEGSRAEHGFEASDYLLRPLVRRLHTLIASTLRPHVRDVVVSGSFRACDRVDTIKEVCWACETERPCTFEASIDGIDPVLLGRCCAQRAAACTEAVRSLHVATSAVRAAYTSIGRVERCVAEGFDGGAFDGLDSDD